MSKWFWVFIALLFMPIAPSVEAAVERIASINFCTDELVLDLMPPDKITGLSIFSKNSREDWLTGQGDHIRYLRGTTEEIVSLRPDLVVAGAYTNPKIVAMLQLLGVSVLRLELPQTFEGVYDNLKRLAARVGRETEAAHLIQTMKAGLDRQTRQPETQKPKIIFIQDRGYVAGRDTFENEIIERLGGINLAAALGLQGHQKISFEKLVSNPPDFMIFTTDQKERESLGRELLSHPIFSSEVFRKTKRFYYPLTKVRCAAPSSVEVLEELQGMIYGAS